MIKVLGLRERERERERERDKERERDREVCVYVLKCFLFYILGYIQGYFIFLTKVGNDYTIHTPLSNICLINIA